MVASRHLDLEASLGVQLGAALDLLHRHFDDGRARRLSLVLSVGVVAALVCELHVKDLLVRDLKSDRWTSCRG